MNNTQEKILAYINTKAPDGWKKLLDLNELSSVANISKKKLIKTCYDLRKERKIWFCLENKDKAIMSIKR